MTSKIIASILFSFCMSNSLLSQIDYKLYTNDDYSYDYASEENATWIASRGGLMKIDHSTNLVRQFNPTNSGLEGVRVNEVEIDIYNTKWFSTGNGLFRFDDVTWGKIELPEDKFPHISNLKASSDGTIWFFIQYI